LEQFGRGETTRLTLTNESLDSENSSSTSYIKGVVATILRLGET